MEVKPAEFARLAGVSRPSVSEKIKNKTLIVNAAGMLDTDNPVNAAYISKHRQKRAETAAAEYTKPQPHGPAPPEVSSSKLFLSGGPAEDLRISELAGVPLNLINMSIREIIMKYPGLPQIERYVKIHKDWTAAAEKEQRIHERNLTLIPKDFVISRIFTFIESLAKQSLEYGEADAEKIIALVQAAGENARNDVIETIRKGIGRILAGAKDQIVIELNNLKSKYQNENQNIDRLEEIKEAIEEARDGS